MGFDFERAHTEIAAPLFFALPAKIHRLLGRVHKECADLAQKPDLDMPWPSGGLREAFEALDTNTLAEASRAVYEYGHWGTRDCFQSHGTYWKFSNYCDQILRARLELPAQAYDRGVSFAVHEGQLRVCYSSTQGWTWTVLGPASLGLLKSARDSWDGCWTADRFDHLAEKFAKVHPTGNLSDYGA